VDIPERVKGPALAAFFQPEPLIDALADSDESNPSDGLLGKQPAGVGLGDRQDQLEVLAIAEGMFKRRLAAAHVDGL
jgi:hypothetical protein